MWPNFPLWLALKEVSFQKEGKTFKSEVHPCGELYLPSGRLIAAEVFFVEREKNPFIVTPEGRFPVFLTVVNWAPDREKPSFRNAYASIVFAQGEEAYRKVLTPAAEGEEPPVPEGENFRGFPVDGGTACFIDNWCGENLLEHDDEFDFMQWFDVLFAENNAKPESLNVVLPKATKGENVIIFTSGYGDGRYPLVGSYNEKGELLAAHIDFFTIPDEVILS